MPTTVPYPAEGVRHASDRVFAVRHFADPRDVALLAAWALLMLVISATMSAPEIIEPYAPPFLKAF